MRAYWQQRNPQTEAAVRQALTLDAIRWQYLHGVPDQSLVSPDTWYHDFGLMGRPGNDLVQLQLFADYADNLPLYPRLHAYLRNSRCRCWPSGAATTRSSVPREHSPSPTTAAGAEICLLDGGHFLLESHLDVAASTIRRFLERTLP